MDTLGAESCRPFIEAANAEHPSLIDVNHVMAERFGVINIPNGIWIDEEGIIVRPAEPAPVPGGKTPPPSAPPVGLPQRMADIMTEASKIVTDRDSYSAALYDWIEHGSNSKFALPPEEVIARSGTVTLQRLKLLHIFLLLNIYGMPGTKMPRLIISVRLIVCNQTISRTSVKHGR
jgi:hypothetical protein